MTDPFGVRLNTPPSLPSTMQISLSDPSLATIFSPPFTTSAGSVDTPVPFFLFRRPLRSSPPPSPKCPLFYLREKTLGASFPPPRSLNPVSLITLGRRAFYGSVLCGSPPKYGTCPPPLVSTGLCRPAASGTVPRPSPLPFRRKVIPNSGARFMIRSCVRTFF